MVKVSNESSERIQDAFEIDSEDKIPIVVVDVLDQSIIELLAGNPGADRQPVHLSELLLHLLGPGLDLCSGAYIHRGTVYLGARRGHLLLYIPEGILPSICQGQFGTFRRQQLRRGKTDARRAASDGHNLSSKRHGDDKDEGKQQMCPGQNEIFLGAVGLV